METIYSFEAPPRATYPAAGPIFSQGGVIYGTTSAGGVNYSCGSFFNCGTVYELAPPASTGGAWTETTLYSFNNGAGVEPITSVVLGAGGKLYGWAPNGNYGNGAVYDLTPPASAGGAWTETLLYSFQGPPNDGGTPVGNLAIGENGSLYGATAFGGTYDQGTVFELAPPASAGSYWVPTVLYSFRGDGDGTNPGAGVAIGENGAIYGTTEGGGALGFGTVFALNLAAGVWEEKVLVSMGSTLDRPVGIALAHNGALDG
jgi:uncharacterized repeat protein (TIGR03803 family)